MDNLGGGDGGNRDSADQNNQNGNGHGRSLDNGSGGLGQNEETPNNSRQLGGKTASGFIDELIDFDNYQKTASNIPIKKRRINQKVPSPKKRRPTGTATEASPSSSSVTSVTPSAGTVQNTGLASPDTLGRSDLIIGGVTISAPPPLRFPFRPSLPARGQPSILRNYPPPRQILRTTGSYPSPLLANGFIATLFASSKTIYTNGTVIPAIVVNPVVSASNPQANVNIQNETAVRTNFVGLPPVDLNRLISTSRPEITITPVTTTSTFVPSFVKSTPAAISSTSGTGNIRSALTMSQLPSVPSPPETHRQISNSFTATASTQTKDMSKDCSTQTTAVVPEIIDITDDPELCSRFSQAVQQRLQPTSFQTGKEERYSRLRFSQVVQRLQPHPSVSPQAGEAAADPDLGISDETEWPALPTPETGSESTDAGRSGVEENWQQNLTILQRFEHLRTSKENKYERMKDVSFEVGSGDKRTKFYAHRFILTMYCEYFKKDLGRRGGRGSCLSVISPIEFPNLDPEAFQSLLDYIYLGELQITDLGKISAVMSAAKAVGCQELVQKCTSDLENGISKDNAAALYYQSLTTNDEILRNSTISYIVKNPREVLISDGFLKISQEALKAILDCDDWYLDELTVFKAVMRWAENNAPKETQETTKRGALLRKTLGDAIYYIRFKSMDTETIFKQTGDSNDGLLESDELLALLRYISGSADPPAMFCIRPRLDNNQSPRVSSATTENVVTPQNQTAETIRPPPDAFKDSPQTLLSPPIRSKIEDTSEAGVETPRKKRKYVRKNSSVCGSSTTPCPQASTTDAAPTVASSFEIAPASAVKDLNAYAIMIGNEQNTENIRVIDEKLKLNILPTIRVCLPNLQQFSLDLFPLRGHQHGTSLKNYLKSKFSSLKEILFFDINNNDGPLNEGGDDGANILKELVSHRVKISIKCADIKILIVNHEDGTLLINFLKDAQKIINGCGNFPLKKLALADCDLNTLEPIRMNLLEEIVMRRVKGLKNYSSFLMQCTNLRKISWNELGGEEINLEQLLHQNRHLVKLALVKCKLTTPNSFLSQRQNFVQQLYLDNCVWKPELVNALPVLFPYVNRVQVYGKQCDSDLLHSILRMDSIKFIFIWKLAHVYQKVTNQITKKKKLVLKEESIKVQEFLTAVFDKKYAKQENLTFILNKNDCDVVQPGPSSSAYSMENRGDPFDASNWTGTKLGTREKYDAVSRHDFSHYSFDTFFSTYENYSFFETTDKDVKRMKGAQIASAPDFINDNSNTSNASN